MLLRRWTDAVSTKKYAGNKSSGGREEALYFFLGQVVVLPPFF